MRVPFSAQVIQPAKNVNRKKEKEEEDERQNLPLSIIHTTFVLNNSPHIFSRWFRIPLSLFYLQSRRGICGSVYAYDLYISFIFRHIKAAHSQTNTMQYTNIPYRHPRFYIIVHRFRFRRFFWMV